MKKYIVAAVFAVTVLCMTGCSTSIIPLSDLQRKEVSLYIADKLLEYDKNYSKNELVYIDITKATPLPEESAAPLPENIVTSAPQTPVPAAPDKPQADTNNLVMSGEPSGGQDADTKEDVLDWNEYFTTEKWKISYSSYNLYKTYPGNSDVFEINASKGKRLLVLFFDVKNLTDEKVKINLAKRKLKYKLYIGDECFEPELALLEDGGLLYLDTSVVAGKSKKTELVFEVPKDIKLTNMRLDVSE